MNESTVKPFLTWLGEERTFTKEEADAVFPLELGVLLQQYLDPFVGRGTILFEVLNRYQLDEVIISDINSDLMNLYFQLQNRIDDLVDHLYTLEKNFNQHVGEEKWAFFKACRCRTDYLKGNKAANNVRRAALFLFLNRVYRLDPYIASIVNARQKKRRVAEDEFARPVICEEATLRSVSEILQPVKILCGDFRECLTYVNNFTFVYIDPPPVNDRQRIATDLSNRKTYPFPKNNDLSVTSFIKIARGFGAEVFDARQ